MKGRERRPELLLLALQARGACAPPRTARVPETIIGGASVWRGQELR